MQVKWSGPRESRLGKGQESLGAGEEVRVRRVKAQERSGEFRGQGKWSGPRESRLRKRKESLGGTGSRNREKSGEEGLQESSGIR